ncbi:MAG TPA: hypothetical protein VIP70_08810 [Nitrososphaeraceae archaeon]
MKKATVLMAAILVVVVVVAVLAAGLAIVPSTVQNAQAAVAAV